MGLLNDFPAAVGLLARSAVAFFDVVADVHALRVFAAVAGGDGFSFADDDALNHWLRVNHLMAAVTIVMVTMVTTTVTIIVVVSIAIV